MSHVTRNYGRKEKVCTRSVVRDDMSDVVRDDMSDVVRDDMRDDMSVCRS